MSEAEKFTGQTKHDISSGEAEMEKGKPIRGGEMGEKRVLHLAQVRAGVWEDSLISRGAQAYMGVKTHLTKT